MTLTTCCICNLGQENEEFFLEMMIKSAQKFSDEIVIVLDKSDFIYPHDLIDEKTKQLMRKSKNKNIKDKYPTIKFIECDYGENFAKARQLAYDSATSDWVFWLDADEVIHEKDHIFMMGLSKTLNNSEADTANVIYTHFYNDLAHIDNSEPIHYGHLRLMKKQEGVTWPNVIHTLPQKVDGFKTMFIPSVNIWHLGYIRGLHKIYERFERNYRNGSFHAPLHQCHWKNWHYSGKYPIKEIDINSIPQVIKDAFMVEVFDK